MALPENEAHKTVKTDRFFTEKDDGLEQRWGDGPARNAATKASFSATGCRGRASASETRRRPPQATASAGSGGRAGP